jgi:hypothetical protein
MTPSKVREIRWNSTDRLKPEASAQSTSKVKSGREKEKKSDVDYLILDRKDLPQEPSQTLGM